MDKEALSCDRCGAIQIGALPVRLYDTPEGGDICEWCQRRESNERLPLAPSR